MAEGVVREEAGKVSSGGYIVPTIGRLEQVLYFTTAPSVTEKAKQILDQGRLRIPGAVVVWDETIGRRTGSKAVSKAWWAGTGSLTFACALPKRPDLEDQERLCRAAAAVLRVVVSFQPSTPAAFRPPNDLVIGEGKLGAVYYEDHPSADLVVVRLNGCTDFEKAPSTVAEGAARLIDFIDPAQLPLGKEGTLPNTFLTRLVTALPKEFGAP